MREAELLCVFVCRDGCASMGVVGMLSCLAAAHTGLSKWLRELFRPLASDTTETESTAKGLAGMLQRKGDSSFVTVSVRAWTSTCVLRTTQRQE